MYPFIKELWAEFNRLTEVVEIFRDGKSIHTEKISCPSDEWFGTTIDDKEVDFNIWLDGDEFVLTIYPDVTQGKDGFWHTGTDVFERIPMTTI